MVATARCWALSAPALEVGLFATICIHAISGLAHRFLLRMCLRADLVKLLADVAWCLIPVAVLAEEAFYHYSPHRPEIVRIIVSAAVFSGAGLLQSLDKLWLLRDRLNRTRHDEAC